jgi:hypothetical protein
VKNRFKCLPFNCNLQRYTSRDPSSKRVYLFHDIAGGGGGGGSGGGGGVMQEEGNYGGLPPPAARRVVWSSTTNCGVSWWGSARWNHVDPYPITYDLSNP